MKAQKKSRRALPAALLASLALNPLGNAATHTYTGSTTGTAPGSTWSSGTGWDLIPISGPTTNLVFGNGTALASNVNVHTSQDIGAPFQLNSLTHSYAGPASNSGAVNINTGGLNFVSNGFTTPTITVNATGTTKPNFVLNCAVTFSADTNIAATTDVTFLDPTVVSGVTTHPGGVISNANNAVVTKSGAGVVRFGTNSGTYTGNFTVTGGTLQIGNNGGTGDVGSGTINLTGGNLIVRRSGSFAINNTITGTGNVTFQPRAASVVSINKANTYTGTTSLAPQAGQVGSVRLGINDALGTTSILTITNTSNTANPPVGSVGTLDLNGLNQTLGGLATSTGGSTTNSKVTLGTGTLTVNDAGNRTFAGEISGAGNVVKQGAGTWTLSNASTYTGTTTISGGTLALGASGAVNSSSSININAGGTFDVSLIPSYTLSANTSLSASGTATAATIKGGSTVNLGSRPITLVYDGANPALTVSQGALTLNGNTITVNASTPLPAGTYTLIKQTTGSITTSGTFTVQGSALVGSSSTLDFSTPGEVKVNVVPAAVSQTNSSVNVSAATLPANDLDTATVTVTLRDGSNNPLPGVIISWTVDGVGNTVSPASSGITDGSGVATFTVKSRIAASKAVSVTAGNQVFNTNLVFTAPSPALKLTWDPLRTSSGSNASGAWSLTSPVWTLPGANGNLPGPTGIWTNNGAEIVDFGNSAALAASYTVSLGSPITVGGLLITNPGINPNSTLNQNQYNISGSGSNILTLAGTPTIDVAANVLFTVPFAGVGFTKTGSGTMRYAADAPSYAGNIAVTDGLLQLGNNSIEGDLGSGTITLAGSSLFTVRKQGTLSLNNLITGSTTGNVNFELNNNAVITLTKANTYVADSGTSLKPTGANTLGTLVNGVANALPTGTAFSILSNGTTSSQTYDLAGFNQTLASLAGDGDITQTTLTSSSGTPTFTVSGTNFTTFSGRVTGSLSLAKSGGGSQNFTGSVAYSGDTTVNGGVLDLPNANANNDASTVTIADTGATLNLNFAGSDTVGELFIGNVQQVAGIYGAIGNTGEGVIQIAQITGPGTLTVLTSPPSNPYDTWSTSFGLSGDNAAKTADPDGDGLINVVEYATGTSPVAALGTPGYSVSRSGDLLSLTYTRIADPALTYTVQATSDLTGVWSTVAVAGNPSTGSANVAGSVTITDTVPITSGKRFLRLQVTY
jgi:fibronectin-binding autotransporter adhesin